MKIKTIKGYAVVNKTKPVIDALEVYKYKDIKIGKSEMIINVTISADETNTIKKEVKNPRSKAKGKVVGLVQKYHKKKTR